MSGWEEVRNDDEMLFSEMAPGGAHGVSDEKVGEEELRVGASYSSSFEMMSVGSNAATKGSVVSSTQSFTGVADDAWTDYGASETFSVPPAQEEFVGDLPQKQEGKEERYPPTGYKDFSNSMPEAFQGFEEEVTPPGFGEHENTDFSSTQQGQYSPESGHIISEFDFVEGEEIKRYPPSFLSNEGPPPEEPRSAPSQWGTAHFDAHEPRSAFSQGDEGVGSEDFMEFQEQEGNEGRGSAFSPEYPGFQEETQFDYETIEEFGDVRPEAGTPPVAEDLFGGLTANSDAFAEEGGTSSRDTDGRSPNTPPPSDALFGAASPESGNEMREMFVDSHGEDDPFSSKDAETTADLFDRSPIKRRGSSGFEETSHQSAASQGSFPQPPAAHYYHQLQQLRPHQEHLEEQPQEHYQNFSSFVGGSETYQPQQDPQHWEYSVPESSQQQQQQQQPPQDLVNSSQFSPTSPGYELSLDFQGNGAVEDATGGMMNVQDPQQEVLMQGSVVPRRRSSASSFEAAAATSAPYIPSNPVMQFREVRREDGRPPHAFATWGFGGRLVTMFPQRRVRLSSLGSSESAGQQPTEPSDGGKGTLRKGNIRMYNIKELCNPDDGDLRSMKYFPGPLISLPPGMSADNDGVRKFLLEGIDRLSGDERLLWQVLLTLADFQGELRTMEAVSALLHVLQNTSEPPKMDSNTVAELFKLSNAHSNEALGSAMAEIETLLLIGDREGAVVRAIEAELWAQALIISNFVSVAVYRRVVEKFVTSTMSPDSQAYSLFLLFAGLGEKALALASETRAKTSANTVGALKQSWSKTLAAILANRTPGDAEVITALGDRLWSELQNVVAAHICYIMAGVPPNSTSGSRIVLIGGDHRHCKTQKQFVTPWTIQLSEVFFFTQTLKNPHNRSDAFHAYRLVYAMWLADLGYVKESFEWVRSIQEVIRARSPSKRSTSTSASGGGGSGPFPNAFTRQLKIFADRLQIYEGITHSSLRDQHDSSWMSSFKLTSIFSKKAPIRETRETGEEDAVQSQQSLIPTPPQQQHQQQFQHQHQTPYDLQQQPTPNQYFEPPLAVPSTAEASSVETKVEERQERSSPTEKRDDGKKSAAGSGKSSTWGFSMQSFKERMVQSFVPTGNAKIAKLGNENKAYYDEKLERWIFPGDDPSLEAQPPLAPPMMDQMCPPSSSGEAGPNVGGGPPTAASMQFNFRKATTRSRYVDTLASSGMVLESNQKSENSMMMAPPPNTGGAPPKFQVWNPNSNTSQPEEPGRHQ